MQIKSILDKLTNKTLNIQKCWKETKNYRVYQEGRIHKFKKNFNFMNNCKTSDFNQINENR